MTRLQKFSLYAFLLSLFFHTLLFFYLFWHPYFLKTDIKIKEKQYVPSYMVRETAKQSFTPIIKPSLAKTKTADQESPQKSIKPATDLPKRPSGLLPKKSLFAISKTMVSELSHEVFLKKRVEEPLYLIGDSSRPPDLLTAWLGKALSKHFYYPELEGRMGIRGRVLIGMTLSPNGTLSEIEMVESSHNEHLDSAALYAVNNAPQINGVERILSTPKHFVIGFVFTNQLPRE